jgi:hypothetical protein
MAGRHSEHVTPGAILLRRAGSKFLVTAAALAMKGIGSPGHVFVIAGLFVTLAARLGIGVLVLCQGMVAVAAREPVTRWSGVRLMIEEDFTGRGFEQDPNRIVWRLGGKGRIAEESDDQQNRGEGVGEAEFLV